MRYLASVLIFLNLIYLATPPVFAHIQGVSIFKINGVNTEIYKPENGFSNLPVPEDGDIAAELYAPNQELSFELDLAKFPVPKEIMVKTNLIWDFGDGSEKETIKYGYKNNHKYERSGNYLLTITADYRTAGFTMEPQIEQAVVIQVSDSVEIRPTQSVVSESDKSVNVTEKAIAVNKTSEPFPTALILLFGTNFIILAGAVLFYRKKQKHVKAKKKKRH